MANSLRAKLSKLRYDGHITDAEYKSFIKKMDGHDAKIRAKAIDEFAERLKEEYKPCKETDTEIYENVCNRIDKIADQLKGGAV